MTIDPGGSGDFASHSQRCVSAMLSLRGTFLGGAVAAAPAARRPAARRPAQTVAEQSLQGAVVSLAGAKSIIVCVRRQVPHPIYQKRMNVSKKFMAHDEGEQAKVGDVVRITQCRPLSARKRFTLAEVVKSAFVMDAPTPSEIATL